ncbi:F-box/FBD/LRR-repeat protein At1g13570-like [Rutidosis leptorrhynchoides]|uniref:F-box/FBD/LRR-repeat protein At1g13570-like n=1 Tax=Rutidosis leptorrhynchoides TaxID=125765 RepID=UPI003A995418
MNDLGSINTLPSDIIENILWRLPTDEIVRASLLSKEWRYNWTKIPKVAFNEDMFDQSTVDENQVPYIEQYYEYYEDFDQILLHLSRMNALKKLHLSSRCELPSSTFSFHQLTNLHLTDCYIDHIPTFNVFGSLTSLCLEYIDSIPKKTLMKILSDNPLLKSFTMLSIDENIVTEEGEYGTLDELFQRLPMIEHFTLCAWDIGIFYSEVIPREVATSLVHLKYLYLEGMCLAENDWLRFLVLVIRSSPNLEKLKPEMQCGVSKKHWTEFDDDLYSVTMQDCSDMWLEHLTELEFKYFGVMKPHLGFLKFILAKSPVLKKVRIKVKLYDNDEALKLLGAISPLQRAFPMMLCEHDDHEDLYSVTMQDCSDIKLKHLIELEIEDNSNTKHELQFVKLILAKSPVLEKVRLNVYYKDEELKLLEALLPSSPASPMVEIIGYCDGKDQVIFTSLKSVNETY